MTASMSSRSRHGSQTSTRSHWIRTSTKRKPAAKAREDKDKDKDKAGKPEEDESRESQIKSRGLPQQERKSKNHYKSDAVKARGTEQRRRRSQSSKTASEGTRKSRTSKISSNSLESHSSNSGSEERSHRRASTSSCAQSKRRSRHSSPSRRHSLPMASELEVTPDDSISQVAARPRHRLTPNSRPLIPKRSTYIKLAPIAEADGNVHCGLTTPRDSTKRQSFLGSLFGRRTTAPVIPAPSQPVQCLTCGSHVPSQRSAKLECGHGMCNDCMARGLKWRACECTPAGYARTSDGDRLLNMRVPQTMVGTGQRRPGVDRFRTQLCSESSDKRDRQEQSDEDLVRRMQLAGLYGSDDDYRRRRRDDFEIWGIGNATGNHMNDDFVQNPAIVTMSTFGDANMGKRGERASGRRRRPKEVPLPREYCGLAPNFLGDASVLGVGPAPRVSRH